jgi:DNA-binding transcriptional LysR family regulator
MSSSIELRQLRYFVTVAEELHFGRAAKRLHMTQPPLSQTILALENTVCAKLFDRNRRGVALTAAGEALLPEARSLLLHAAALPELVQRAAAGESGRLSLGFVSIADYSVLPPALRDFRERYPHVQLNLREATTDVQLDYLKQGAIDAGLLIAPLPADAKAELSYLPLLSEPLMLAAPQGNRALHGRTVMLKNLGDQPLIIFPRKIAPGFHDSILSCFHEAGLTPRIGQEAIQMQTIVSLVSAGMGIALVPQSMSNLKRPGVEYRTLVGKSPLVETGVAWRRDNTSPVLQAFLKLLQRKNQC